jgi:hypothetical protein
LGSAAAQGLQAQNSSPAVRYRLAAGSTLTHEIDMVTLPPVTLTSTSLVQGAFKLTRQVSPLDWEIYALTELVATAPDLEEGPLIVGGGGTYRVGGRGEISQQLDLTLRGTMPSPLQLTSGSLPVKQAWPVLDITVKGKVQLIGAAHIYTLRLVAVPELSSWHYRLLGPSFLLDDCPPCDRLSMPQPLRGGFDLVLFAENPITSRYALCDLDLAVGSGDTASYRVAGSGFMEIGGEVGVNQVLNLDATVASAAGKVIRSFTNDSPMVTQLWPMLAVDLTDTAGELAQVYHLHLLAAPLRELWFSTVHSLTSGNGKLPDKLVTSGDVLCDLGRIIKRNAELMGRLGLMPGFGDYGIDALDVMPGGEVVFSLNDDVFSESLGPLSQGDLLSARGRVVKRNLELMARFFVTLPVPEVGLDAVQVMDDGEILFSIRQDVFSDAKGMLCHGDLLSDRGEVRRNNQQLLARFQPPDPKHDYGLDAVYVWPSGEIWFSTEEGFEDPVWKAVTDGDLLSDQGYVVFRNLELVNAFGPVEDLDNFGLDGLFVVTDAAAAAAAPSLLGVMRPAANGDVTLRWEGKGRVFQLERTFDLTAPFTPCGAITPDLEWPDPGVVLGNAKAFYRVRQW